MPKWREVDIDDVAPGANHILQVSRRQQLAAKRAYEKARDALSDYKLKVRAQ